jgi:uncharacterized protein YbjT (DUF2867 family)
MILVVGATGTTGRAVLRELAGSGGRVRALTRSAEGADALRELGAEPVVGDLADPVSLAAAFDGIERAYVATPASEHQAELEANAYAVAEQAGVYHVVKLGVHGQSHASPMRVARAHAEAFEVLEASSLRWTLLQCCGFMQNYLRTPPGLTARPDAKVAHVDARDIGAVAARALTEEGHEAATYVLTGPEALSDAEIAALLGDVLGREVRVVPVSDDDLAAGLRQAGLNDWLVEALLEVNAYNRSGATAQTTPDVEAVLGRPATSFRRFAEDHRADFPPAG